MTLVLSCVWPRLFLFFRTRELDHSVVIHISGGFDQHDVDDHENEDGDILTIDQPRVNLQPAAVKKS